MNYLLAKLKGKRGGIRRVISQNAEFLALPNFQNAHPYSPRRITERDEWYTLKQASIKKYENPFRELIDGQRLNTIRYGQITVPEYQAVHYFCFTSKDYFLFQKITPSQMLKKKWLSISEEPKFQNTQKIIILNEYVDAAINRKCGTLYFKDIGRIKDLYIGIEELYREATQEEVQSFIKQDFLELTDGYTIEKIKTKNRKLIALVIDKIQQFSGEDKRVLLKYGKEYLPQNIKKNKFVAKSEDDLKNILYLIDERFYKGPISSEKMLANSVTTIEQH